MIFCTECGHQVAETDKFCGQCGKPLALRAAQKPAPGLEVQRQPAPRKPATKLSKAMPWLVLAGALLVFPLVSVVTMNLLKMLR